MSIDLSGAIKDIDAPNNTIYQSFANDRIPKFLEQSPLYDSAKKEWKKIRQVEQEPTKKSLYAPLKDIIFQIFQTFAAPRGENRWAEDTQNVSITDIEGDSSCKESTPNGKTRTVPLKPSPGLSIMGNGSHISGSNMKPKEPHYRYCLCPVEVITSTFDPTTVMLQSAVYARQCFFYQPYRRYVPVVVIAGSNLYLHIFDRAGALRSAAIDIHEDPNTFVRIILGVSTVGNDLQFSPFDPRVRWKRSQEHPTITVRNKTFNMAYKVTGQLFSHTDINCRGTYCANAEARSRGKVVPIVIKHAWRTSDQAAEWQFLDKIKGLDGVGQILAYDENQPTVNTFRQHIMATYSDDEPLHERVFSRLVLQAYGRSICHFTSQLQLLEAFYDAVMGHKNLWNAGILHRDISIENILLGLKNATVGNRGVLIDFDMAIAVDSPCVYRAGTRAFKSTTTLAAPGWGDWAPPQDHLDDLESYFYVLAWICITYQDAGSLSPSSPKKLKTWTHSSDDVATGSKLMYLLTPSLGLAAYFATKVFRDLLNALGDLCEERRKKKWAVIKNRRRDYDRVFDPKKEELFPPLHKVHEQTKDGKDHDEFLAIIEVAINALKSAQKIEEETDDSRIPPAENVEPVEHADANLQPSPKLSGIKRSHADSNDGGNSATGPLTKKRKISRPTPPVARRRSLRLQAKK